MNSSVVTSHPWVESQVKSSQTGSSRKSSQVIYNITQVKSSQVRHFVKSSQVKSQQKPSQVKSSQIFARVNSSQVLNSRVTGVTQVWGYEKVNVTRVYSQCTDTFKLSKG